MLFFSFLFSIFYLENCIFVIHPLNYKTSQNYATLKKSITESNICYLCQKKKTFLKSNTDDKLMIN